MKMGHVVWLGDEKSFFEYQALEEKYFGAEPQPLAYSGHDEDEPSFNEEFGVRADRIGLMLLEKSGSTTFLKVHGTMVDRHKWWHAYFPGEVVSYDAIIDALDIVVKDESKNRVVMDFATGGGYVRGLDNASQKLKWARNFVEIIAHTDSSAFSAGYWLASSARRLTASRMAEVGSIGTLLITYSMVRSAEKEGVDYRVFRAGEFKALGNPYEELTEKAAAHIQENLDKTNKFFLEHVSISRNLMMSERERWAEGKTFFAQEAKDVGLIDQVTTLAELLGSGASQTSTSDSRRFEMNISDEKLAQIAAGADPKDVLTAEELTMYQASLETDPEAEEPAVAAADEEEVPQAADEKMTVIATADLMAMTKLAGKMEAKVETLEAKLEEMGVQAAARETETVALMEVAQAGLGMLFTALGKPKENPTTVAGVTAKFAELQGEMTRRFKTGRQSAETPTAEGSESQVVSFRHM